MTRERKWEDNVSIGISTKMMNYLNKQANKNKCSRYSMARRIIVMAMYKDGINVTKELDLLARETEEASGSYWLLLKQKKKGTESS